MSALRSIALLFVGLALVAARGETPNGSPDCTVYWIVPETCPDAQVAFRTGVLKWNLNDGCRQQPPVDQMCEFFMIGGRNAGSLSVPQTGLDPNIIRVYHVYLPEVYLEVSAFNFTSVEGGCFITGESVSAAWADNDVGQTYCAMERMMLESGMPDMDGYSQMTSDAICPNYSNSDCFEGNTSRS